jgi:hypothetical protein
MSALDHFLYFDEDNDIDTDEMTDWTPVDPLHLVELYERGLLALREVFSHKGWHHKLILMRWKDSGDEYHAQMWDGPTGEEYWCHDVEKYQTWG